MKILYGLVGEGQGQALRSRVLLDELVKRHEVFVVISGPAKADLEKRFPHVYSVGKATNVAETRALQTEIQGLKAVVGSWPQSVRHYFELIGFHRPDVVLSDSDAFSVLFAKMRYLPLLSLDHLQVINRAKHDPQTLAGLEQPFEEARKAIKARSPGAFHYLITSFFHPPLRKDRTTLLPPILRPEILAAKAEKGDHLLVYLSGRMPSGALEALVASKLPCRVYGVKSADVVEGAITYRPPSEQRFVEDLRTARAVIGDGGFTLMSEALALKKPMLSVPTPGEFEELLNAVYLEKLGYGARAEALTAEGLSAFLAQAPRHEQALAGYQHEGNGRTFQVVEEQLQRANEHKGIWAEVTVPEGIKRRGIE